jgi:hypothetical protein
MNIHSSATINEVSLNALHRAEHVRTSTQPRAAKLSRLDRDIKNARIRRAADAFRSEAQGRVYGFIPVV